MIEKIKHHMKDIVDVTIQYVNYNFISSYNNCLLICIEKGKLDKNLLVFLTEEGKTKLVELEDQKNVKVSIDLVCQK